MEHIRPADIERRSMEIITSELNARGITLPEENAPIIKRVIGRAGDEIDIDFDTGEVRRNGMLLDEPYINEPTYINLGAEFPAVVPEGHIFVLGDNRNHSSDSRDVSIGMIDLRQVMGRAVFRFFPVSAAGALTD